MTHGVQKPRRSTLHLQLAASRALQQQGEKIGGAMGAKEVAFATKVFRRASEALEETELGAAPTGLLGAAALFASAGAKSSAAAADGSRKSSLEDAPKLPEHGRRRSWVEDFREKPPAAAPAPAAAAPAEEAKGFLSQLGALFGGGAAAPAPAPAASPLEC